MKFKGRSTRNLARNPGSCVAFPRSMVNILSRVYEAVYTVRYCLLTEVDPVSWGLFSLDLVEFMSLPWFIYLFSSLRSTIEERKSSEPNCLT